MSVRASRIVRWCVAMAVTVALGVPVWLLGSAALTGPLRPMLVPAALAGVVVLVLLAWLITTLPREWAGQDVTVGDDGLVLAARQLAWFRGREAFVAWADVAAVRRGTRTAGRRPGVSRGPAAILDRLTSLGHEVTLELHLVREIRLNPPSWASPATPIRLVLTLADTPRRDVEGAVGVVRPGLLEPPPTSPRRTGAGWVSLRGAGFLPRWQGTVGPTLYVIGLGCAALLVYAGVDGIAHGFSADDLPVIALLAPCGAAALAWTLHRLPRLLTRQGVAAGADGVTLVQEPTWWFPGATVHLPWPAVRSVGEDVLIVGDHKNRRSHLIVELRLHRDQPGPLPSWVEAKSRRRQTTGLVIVPGRRRHARVLAVLRDGAGAAPSGAAPASPPPAQPPR